MAKKPTAAEKKAAKEAAKSAAPRDLLAEAVNALNTNQPLMATEAEMSALLHDPRGPLVEFNANFKQGDKIAFRATAFGKQVQEAGPQGQPQTQAPAWGAPAVAGPAPGQGPVFTPPAATQAPAATGTGKFTFQTGIPVPAPRRGGRGSTVYGFEQMEIGQSFFIDADTENPNPAKRIASTVSSASTRLEPRKFVVRSVDETGQGGKKGARVWRTA